MESGKYYDIKAEDRGIFEVDRYVSNICEEFGEEGFNSSNKDSIWFQVLRRAKFEGSCKPWLGESDRGGYIYATENTLNGMVYIGKRSSKVIDRYYKGSGIYFQRALNKYGWDNFHCVVLEWVKKCDSVKEFKDLINEREIYWIKLFNAVEDSRFYNKSDGGDGFSPGEHNPMYGVHLFGSLNGNYRNYWSEEQKKALSEKRSGTKMSEEARRNISEAHRGLKYNYTEESRRQKSIKFSGKNNPMYGKVVSEETRKKISKANKGNPAVRYYPSDEEKRAQSIKMKKYYETHNPPNKGVPMSREQRDLLRHANKRRTPVKCLETGKSYGSITEAAELTGIPWNTLSRYLEYTAAGKSQRKYKYEEHTWVFIERMSGEDPYAKYKNTY